MSRSLKRGKNWATANEMEMREPQSCIEDRLGRSQTLCEGEAMGVAGRNSAIAVNKIIPPPIDSQRRHGSNGQINVLARVILRRCRLGKSPVWRRGFPVLLMLEDNPERLERFTAVLRTLDPELPLRVWRDAHAMIRETEPLLSSATLISLDHNLGRL